MILDILGTALIIIGLFFVAVTAIGVLRLPDFFSRVHAVSKTETLGIGLVMLGLAFHAPSLLTGGKLVFATVFVFIANPVSAHLLTRAAIRKGVFPWRNSTNPNLGRIK
jgi:multicomponent Na+:H+ antiporter subunit G